jgi:hypothetical protein
MKRGKEAAHSLFPLDLRLSKVFDLYSHMVFHSGSLSMREQERELYCGLGISLFFIGSPGCLFSYEAARSSLFPLPYDLLYP